MRRRVGKEKTRNRMEDELNEKIGKKTEREWKKKT